MLVGVVLIALNLRGAVAAVAPVLPDIRHDLGMSAAAAGLLTTIPVLCFALLAPPAVALGRRVGLGMALLLGCAAIVVGTLVRVVDGVPVLLAGTLLIGAGMTVGNVLIPVLVKRDFPRRAGSVTGLYSAAMVAGASVTAALSVPLAGVWGWRSGIAVWAVLGVVAAVVWVVGERRSAGWRSGGWPPVATRGDDQVVGAPVSERPGLLRSSSAWGVSLFLGAQAATYYTITAWLPTMLVDDVGVSPEAAGAGMSVFQALGIVGSLLIPALVVRRAGQGWVGLLVAGGWTLMVVGLLVLPGAWLVWAVVGGVAQGAGLALAMTLIVLRAGDTATTRSLSGMAQLVGYLIAAVGPVAFGALYERTGTWVLPLASLLVICVGMAAGGVIAGRDVTITARPAAASR